MSTGTLQAITIIVSISSLVLSVIALTWQFVAWRFNGSVVNVELLAGAAGRGGVASGKIETFVPGRLVEQGFHELLFIVRARNVGRMPVDVTHWSVAMPSGFSYTLPDFHLNRTLPYRLEAGSVVDFYAPMGDVYKVVHAMHTSGVLSRVHANQVRGVVSLATGRERGSSTHQLPRLSV